MTVTFEKSEVEPGKIAGVRSLLVGTGNRTRIRYGTASCAIWKEETLYLCEPKSMQRDEDPNIFPTRTHASQLAVMRELKNRMLKRTHSAMNADENHTPNYPEGVTIIDMGNLAGVSTVKKRVILRATPTMNLANDNGLKNFLECHKSIKELTIDGKLPDAKNLSFEAFRGGGICTLSALRVEVPSTGLQHLLNVCAENLGSRPCFCSDSRAWVEIAVLC